MATLTEFLLARVAEDEAAARGAAEGPWWVPANQATWETTVRASDWTNRRGWRRVGQVADAENAAHIARHNPARVLAECKAKRAVVDLCADVEQRDDATGHHARATLWALVGPYTSHPDFRWWDYAP